MIPTLDIELSAAPAGDQHTRAHADAGEEIDIIGALLEALSTPERYRLCERGGEIHIVPLVH